MCNRFCRSITSRAVPVALLLCVCGAALALNAPSSAAAPAPASMKTLQMYFVDVEGGQATIFVTPEGKSLLIDTGWSGFDGR